MQPSVVPRTATSRHTLVCFPLVDLEGGTSRVQAPSACTSDLIFEFLISLLQHPSSCRQAQHLGFATPAWAPSRGSMPCSNRSLQLSLGRPRLPSHMTRSNGIHHERITPTTFAATGPVLSKTIIRGIFCLFIRRNRAPFFSDSMGKPKSFRRTPILPASNTELWMMWSCRCFLFDYRASSPMNAMSLVNERSLLPFLYRATAEFSTCVLKNPPLVRSITCW